MTEDERNATFENALSTTTIYAPTDILSSKYLFSLRRRVDPVLEKRQSHDD
jgi:hypothetical protein